jgi:phosphohistidine phosphatase
MQKKPDNFYYQSAVIPYRIVEGKIQVLMITSRRKKRWIIPKGIIEPELSAADSAAKEAFEEAGLEGQVSTSPIGTYEYEKWGNICRVQVFVMHVKKVWDEWEENSRAREWVSLETAIKRVQETRLKQILRGLPLAIYRSSVAYSPREK